MTSINAQNEATFYSIRFNQVGEKILVEQEISFEQEAVVKIKLPEDVRAISANVNYIIKNSLIEAKGKEIKISYITNENLEKVKGRNYFVEKLSFNFDIKELEVRLLLDEGFFLDKEDVFPKPLAIETDGRRIWVVWNLKDVKKGQDMPIFVIFRSTGIDITRILIFVLIAVISVILGLHFMRRVKKLKEKARKKRRKKKPREGIEIEEYLIASEKAVIKELKKAEKKELWQKQLQLKTGFSKAKLSRVIRNLEARNLIKKIPVGNTNRIKLS